MENTKKNRSVNAVPEGLHSVTPYLVVDNAAGLIDFIEKAFSGKVTSKMLHQDQKKIMHATVTIGDSTIMISDTMPGMEDTHTAMLYLYLDNVDDVFKKAIAAKGTSVREVKDEFYGDRAGAVKDSWGNVWWIATHTEDVDPKELERRAEEFEKQQGEVHA
jgi:PhnB protein